MKKPYDKLYFINFILYKVLDHLVLCSPNFTADLFTNKAQFDTRF